MDIIEDLFLTSIHVPQIIKLTENLQYAKQHSHGVKNDIVACFWSHCHDPFLERRGSGWKWITHGSWTILTVTTQFIHWNYNWKHQQQTDMCCCPRSSVSTSVSMPENQTRLILNVNGHVLSTLWMMSRDSQHLIRGNSTNAKVMLVFHTLWEHDFKLVLHLLGMWEKSIFSIFYR